MRGWGQLPEVIATLTALSSRTDVPPEGWNRQDQPPYRQQCSSYGIEYETEVPVVSNFPIWYRDTRPIGWQW